MEADTNFNLGRASEITRDELKFTKFVQRLRNKFTTLFDNILEIQLVLTGVTTRAEFKEMKEHIHYDFLEDNHFTELKYGEIMGDRLRLLGEVDAFVGKYFSKEYVRKSVLRMNEDEIRNEEDRMKTELQDEPEEEDGEDQQQDQQPEQEPEPEQPQESFQAANTISEEEKSLVNSMTKIIEETLDDKAEEDGK